MSTIKTLLTTVFLALLAILAKANPIGGAAAIPWAKANPHAAAAAQGFADAYAEAIAISHPDPDAYALAASADDCASYACHASCGYLILTYQECESSYGYFDTDSCCNTTEVNEYYDSCLECGWTLWKYYGPYLSGYLQDCQSSYNSAYSTEPTGTLRCSTTLSSSYSTTSIDGYTYITATTTA